MMGQTNKIILSNSLQRTLRRNMTDAEQVVWGILRGRQVFGHKFRRQHPFGDYILDFVCLELMLVIEIDGGHHQEQIDADGIRTQHLENAGFRVERFWNNEVLQDIEAVKERISIIVQELDPSPPQPSP
jgi:very-short-patch-repair endonuclease